MEALLIIIPTLSLLGRAFIVSAIIIFFLYVIFLGNRRALSYAQKNNFLNKFENRDFPNEFVKKSLSALSLNIYNFRAEALFFLWCFFSCIWSIDKLYSISTLLSLLLVIFIFFKASSLSFYITNNRNNHYFKFLSFGLSLSVFIFFIEYYTRGALTFGVHKIFQSNYDKAFNLYFLDRGSVFLSLISWVVITSIIYSKKASNLKHLYAAIIYFTILFLLYKSDSLAGFLGFLVGGIVYLFIRLLLIIFKSKFISNLVLAIVLIANLLLPIFFYKMDTHNIVNKYENILPDSAIHRLFIWNYAMKKSNESLFLGHGFASSKELGKLETQTIKYKEHDFKMLPIHPHNILVQIILELGLVGFLLYNILIFNFIRRIINLSQKNRVFLSFTLCAFTNCYFVALISFGVWQFWFVCTILFLIFNFKILYNKIFIFD